MTDTDASDDTFVTLTDEALAQTSGGFLYEVFGPLIDWGTAKVAAPTVSSKLYGKRATPQATADIETALRGAMRRTKQKPKFVPF